MLTNQDYSTEPEAIEALRGRIQYMQDKLEDLTSMIPEIGGAYRIPQEAYHLILAIETATKALAWAEENYQENPQLFATADDSWLMEYGQVR